MIREQQESYLNGLVQDCGNSIALAMELPQSCIKPPNFSLIYEIPFWSFWRKCHNEFQQTNSYVKVSGDWMLVLGHVWKEHLHTEASIFTEWNTDDTWEVTRHLSHVGLQLSKGWEKREYIDRILVRAVRQNLTQSKSWSLCGTNILIWLINLDFSYWKWVNSW